MTIDWTKPIETYCGCAVKIISDDYRTVRGCVLRVVQVDFKEHSTVWYVDADGSNPGGGKVIRNRKVKKEAWQNLYRQGDATYAGNTLFKTEGEARKIADISANHVATLKLEWEE